MSAYDDLAAGLGPKQLVPGQLGEIELMAISCAAYAEQLVRTRQAVGYIQLNGSSWSGKAADVYQAVRLAHLEKLRVAASAFEVAAQALASYATALSDARQVAAVALASFRAAEQALSSCSTATSASVLRPVPATPAFPVTVQSAVAQLEGAREDVRVAGDAAAKALTEAATWSPAAIDPDPGIHLPSPRDLLNGLKELPRGMATGPYHLVHGYFSTLITSAKGLGMAQYAGPRGITGPDYSAEYDAAQAEGLDGALNTLGLLGAGEGVLGALAMRASREGIVDVVSYLRTLPKGSGSEIRNVATRDEVIALHKVLTERARVIARADYRGSWMERSDGLQIGLRVSRKHGPTIDIYIPELKDTWKVHFDARSR